MTPTRARRGGITLTLEVLFMPAAFTRADLDRAHRQQATDKPIRLRGHCHPDALLEPTYADGMIELRCTTCSRLVGCIAVAATLESVVLLGGADER